MKTLDDKRAEKHFTFNFGRKKKEKINKSETIFKAFSCFAAVLCNLQVAKQKVKVVA